MSNSGNEILDMYLYETNTLLEQLDSIVLAAEHVDSFSEDDVNEIFRIMHTIKGSSAMMEFTPLMTIAHRIEDLFFIIRDKGMNIVAEEHRPLLFDLMFQAIDYFRSEVAKIENSEPFSENIDTFIENINSFIAKIQQEPSSGAPAAASAPAADASPAASADAAIAGFGTDPAHPHLLHVLFDEGCGMENLRAFMLVTSVRDFCADEVFTFVPEDVETNPETAEFIVENGFLLRFANAADRDKAIPAVTASGSVKTYQIADEAVPAPKVEKAEQAAPAAAKKPAGQETAAPAAAPKAAPAAAATPAPHSKESLISVNLSKLDHLMAVVGEIVITESMVTSSPDLKGLKLDTFTKSARQLRKLTDELQDVAMSLRMVPVSGTFQKMNRIVRDMSKKLNKPARLTLVGEDTEVDKTIVDNISDPIMHIVRNSMDHGLEENTQDRIDAGKDPVGEITLAARHTGSEVIIEIRDDGQGANYDAVLEKARRVGLAQPDVEYSQREILNFLMMPGFSTNIEVTEFSGRGVGMDVVKKNVEDVGGTVVLSSEPGRGMTTTLKIPLTMAIMDGMEIAVGHSIFTISINNIRQIFRVSSANIIQDAGQKEMIKCMDSFYPLIRLRDLYQLKEGLDNVEEGIVLWVESGECSYCLFVDELIGEQQVVVKPLPEYVNSYNIKTYGISGCTILGDGNISIILDVANLYSAAQGL